MSDFLVAVSALLVANAGIGLLRVVRGPSALDRVLAVQLVGTTGVAVLLLLAEAGAEPSLRDVAMVFVLLAAVLSVAFVKRLWIRGVTDPETEED